MNDSTFDDFSWTDTCCTEGQFVISLALNYATEEPVLRDDECDKFLSACLAMLNCGLLSEKDVNYVRHCLGILPLSVADE